jgi:hypothetical protein
MVSDTPFAIADALTLFSKAYQYSNKTVPAFLSICRRAVYMVTRLQIATPMKFSHKKLVSWFEDVEVGDQAL